jgi:hypothetical protein
MSKMYIYSNETNEHVATVIGAWDDDRVAVAAAETAGYSTNDYSNTCSPAFGFSGGLVENPDAEIIEIEPSF